MMNWRFRGLRRLVRLHKAGHFLLVPRLNGGCVAVHFGRWYVDAFVTPRFGMYFNTPLYRGWFWPSTLTFRRQR